MAGDRAWWRGRRPDAGPSCWGEPPEIVGRSALQPERTALAWQRTLLACALAAVPMVAADVISRQYAALLPTGVLIAGLLVGLRVLGARPRQIRQEGWHVSPWPRLLGVAVAVCLLAVLGVVTTLVRFAAA